MNPEAAADWAEHLTNPYAMTAFVVLTIVGLGILFKSLPLEELKSNETFKLLRLLIIGALLLGGIAIFFAFTPDLLKPKTQEVRNITGSDVSVGGNQATVATSKQKVDMKTNLEKCGSGNQIVDGVADSRLTLAGCEASTTAKE